MRILLAVLFIALLFLLGSVIKAVKGGRIRERSTASVNGTIHDVFSFKSHRDHSTPAHYWRIRFTVGGMEYGLLQEAHLIGRKEMTAHIGEPVTVHYDPSDPRVAWADTPGRHAYANDKAGYFHELGW